MSPIPVLATVFVMSRRVMFSTGVGIMGMVLVRRLMDWRGRWGRFFDRVVFVRDLTFARLNFQDAFFHLLARLERDDKFGGHFHSIPSARIASTACRSFFDFKHSEVSEFNPVSRIIDKGVDNRLKRFLDNLFGLQLG